MALTQYGAILAAGVLALLAQAPIASTVLGEGGADVALPAGLTIGMLLLLGVFGVLGFLLYGVLYAAAGSLVSRQEDVQAAVMPLTFVSTAAYLVAVYSATGLLDIRDGWISIIALVPFVSPFMILSQVTAGVATVPEVIVCDRPPRRLDRDRALDRGPDLRRGRAPVRPATRPPFDLENGPDRDVARRSARND